MEKDKKNIARVISKNFVNNQASFIAKITPVEDEYPEEEGITLLPSENLDTVILCEEMTNLNGASAIEGELLISKNKKIDASVDLDGNLILFGDDMDSYEINEMGELIYKY